MYTLAGGHTVVSAKLRSGFDDTSLFEENLLAAQVPLRRELCWMNVHRLDPCLHGRMILSCLSTHTCRTFPVCMVLSCLSTTQTARTLCTLSTPA